MSLTYHLKCLQIISLAVQTAVNDCQIAAENRRQTTVWHEIVIRDLSNHSSLAPGPAEAPIQLGILLVLCHLILFTTLARCCFWWLFPALPSFLGGKTYHWFYRWQIPRNEYTTWCYSHSKSGLVSDVLRCDLSQLRIWPCSVMQGWSDGKP